MSNFNLTKKLIFKKFQVGKLIYKSNLAAIHQGINILNGEQVAMKFEKIASKYNLLESEAYLLFLLRGVGIPRIISYGKTFGFRVIVEELLGETIYSIWNIKKNDKNKLNDICLIAIQCLDRLKYIHSKNIIHRDIKPFNFLFGKKDPDIIYLIDFGISKKYRSSRTGKHIKFEQVKKISGSSRYMSLNSNRGYEQSRRDDLESLGYMLIFLIKKTLPWIFIENLKISKMEKHRKIHQKKLSTLPEQLCSGLPKEFCDYIKYCRNLNFEQEPNYNYLRNLFLNIIKKNERISDLTRIELMRFSWLKNKDMKKGKFDYFNLGHHTLLSGMETDTSSKGKENTHRRLYKLVKDSIERAKSQDLPKIRNNNFFKFDLKNINIILNNINSIGKNINNKNSNKNRIIHNISEEINIKDNINFNKKFFEKRLKKDEKINKIDKLLHTNLPKRSRVILNDRFLLGAPSININNFGRDKRFNISSLSDFKKCSFLNNVPDISLNYDRKCYYKTLQERKEEKDKLKLIHDRIKNNILSMDFKLIYETDCTDRNNYRHHMRTDESKKIYINKNLLFKNKLLRK